MLLTCYIEYPEDVIDCKDTKDGSEGKIKNEKIYGVFVAIIFLSYLNGKTQAINKRMLIKWDYSCNQNFSTQKSFSSTKL